MKTKQLANVLIKILGLSVLVHAIPSLISELLPMLQAIGYPIGYPQGTVWNHYWLFAFSQVVMLAMGIYLMVKSRDVTAFLFKDEEE